MSKLDTIYSRATPVKQNFRDMLDEVRKRYGDIPTFFGAYRNPVGLEIEIEGTTQGFVEAVTNTLLWNGVADNSLKDAGWEMVSVPIAGHAIDYAFLEYTQLRGRYKSTRFSHRCSLHVHMNMAGYTEEQLSQLFHYYVLMEGALFSYCDPVRRANSFCIPITDMDPLGNSLLEAPENMKYCAFNTAPLARQLTVEIRIHEGTNDTRKMRRWVQILCKLHKYATSRTPAEFQADLEQFRRGSITPLENMLTLHAGMFSKDALSSSSQLGYEWLSMYKG